MESSCDMMLQIFPSIFALLGLCDVCFHPGIVELAEFQCNQVESGLEMGKLICETFELSLGFRSTMPVFESVPSHLLNV